MSELLVLPEQYEGVPIPASLRKGEYSGFVPRHILRLIQYYNRTDIDGMPVTRDEVRRLVDDSGFFAELLESRAPRKDGLPYLSHTTFVADDLVNDAEEYGIRYLPAVFRIAYGHDHKEDLPEYLWARVVARFGRGSREVKGISALSKIKSSELNRLAPIDQSMQVLSPLMRTFADDFICIRVKGGDVRHNTLTLEYMSSRQQRNTAMRNRRIITPLMDEANLFSLKHEIDDWSVSFIDPAGFNYAKGVYEYVSRIDDLLRDEFEQFVPSLYDGGLNVMYFEKPHIASVYDAIRFQTGSVGSGVNSSISRSPFEYYHPKFTLVAQSGVRNQFLANNVPTDCSVERYEHELIVHEFPFPFGLRGTLSIIDVAFVWAKLPITVLEASQKEENKRAARKLRSRMRQAIMRQHNGDEIDFARTFTDSVGKKAKRAFVTVNGKPHKVLIGQRASKLDILAAVLEPHELERVLRIQYKEEDSNDVTMILPDNARLRVSLGNEPVFLPSLGKIDDHLTPPARDFVRERQSRKMVDGRLSQGEQQDIVSHGVERLERQLRRHLEVSDAVSESFSEIVRDFTVEQGQKFEEMMMFYALCTERFVMHEITERFMEYLKSVRS